MLVLHLDRMTFNGNAPLPLQVHTIQDLILHDFFRERVSLFQQTVCQGGFAVVDMGNDTKIPYAGCIHSRKLQIGACGLEKEKWNLAHGIMLLNRL